MGDKACERASRRRSRSFRVAQDGKRIDRTPLYVAARSCEGTEVVRALVTAGADPNLAKSGGRTPLHGAADAGRVDILLYLLEAGANIDAVDQARQESAKLEARVKHAEAQCRREKENAKHTLDHIGVESDSVEDEIVQMTNQRDKSFPPLVREHPVQLH